jgi:hypothetical protein
MTKDNWYWIIMFVWLIVGGIGAGPDGVYTRWFRVGGWFVIPFILFVLVGLRIFGDAVK